MLSSRIVLGRRLCAAMLALQMGSAAAAGAERWDLRDLYPSAASWDSAYQAVRTRAESLDRFKATLGASAASLLEALAAISDVKRESERLETYASLQADEDLREPRAQEREQRARALDALIEEKTAWVAPAVQALGAERVRGYVAAEPALKARFDLQLGNMLRYAPHTLSPEGEALLAAAGPVLGQPQDVFKQLSDAELPRSKVRLVSGRLVDLTTSAYEEQRTSPIREDRKRVFDGFFGAFKRVEGTFGAALTSQVMGDVFSARARRFGGALEAALFDDNMPPAVYRTLIEQARAGLPTLHRYLRLRARMLGLRGPLAYYDNYVSLVALPRDQRWSLERSKAMTLQALAPMGDEYLALLKKGFASSWVDSHPRPGKASGAYMSGGAYDVHPYVLLNHNDDFESLSTVAHEFGHAVHSQLSNAQPFEKADYSTFIAESASIGNEMLLGDHMVSNAKTRADKLFYLAQGLESIRTTYFRQAMFAEFELAMHEEVEQGRPLSGARLTDLYCGIAKRYYGEADGVMTVDPAYCVEWAYVGHFYRRYYVWQYATSMVGAAQFTEAIQREGAPARDRFIDLLKAGGADYAYPLYVKAGVDLAQAAPYQALMVRMNRLMDEFERLTAAPRR